MNSQKRLIDDANRRRPKRGCLFRLAVLFGAIEEPLITRYMQEHRGEIEESGTCGTHAYIQRKDGSRVHIHVKNGELIEDFVEGNSNMSPDMRDRRGRRL